MDSRKTQTIDRCEFLHSTEMTTAGPVFSPVVAMLKVNEAADAGRKLKFEPDEFVV